MTRMKLSRTSPSGPLGTFASVCVAFARRSARARLRAGGPGRSDCGTRPCGPGALRCSLRGAAAVASRCRWTRHRINPPRRSAAARRTSPTALRCSAPQIRALTHPPTALRETAWRSSDVNSKRRHATVGGCKDRGQCPDGRICAGEERSAAGGSPPYPADRRGGFMQCRVQRHCEATAAAPAERAPQRTRAAGEGGAAKPGGALPSGLARAEVECGERPVDGGVIVVAWAPR